MKELKLVAKGGLLSLLGDASNYSLSYVFLFIATHWLGAALLGAYYWAWSITGLLNEFADCGTGQALIYYGPKYEAEKGADKSLPLFRFVLGFTLLNGVILAILLFSFAPLVARSFQKPELAWLLRLFAVALPLSVFWPVLYKYCVARFKIATGILYGDVFRPIIRVLMLLAFVVIGYKGFALVGTELMVGAVLLLTGLLVIIKLWQNKLFEGQLSWREKKAVLLYAIPFLPLNLARGERLIIIITGFFLAVAQIGVFGVVLKIAALSQVILTGLNFVFRPMVSKLYAEKDLATLRSIYRSITRWIFILTLPLSFFFVFYPAQVLALFGGAFSAGAAALTIVALGYLFEYGTSATQVIINMTGKSWLSLMNQLIYLSVIAALAIWLVPGFGLIGAATAVAGAIVAINLLRLYQSYRIVGFLPYSRYLVKPVLAALLAGTIIYVIFPPAALLPLPKMLLMGIIYLMLYGGVIVGLGFDHDDKELLLAARRKILGQGG